MKFERKFGESRQAHLAILEAIDADMLDPRAVLEAALGWMNDNEVEEMAFANCFFEAEDEEEEEDDPLDNPNYVGSRYHY